VLSNPRPSSPGYPTGILIGIGALTVVGGGLVAAAAPGAWRLGIIAAAVAAFAALALDLVAVPVTVVLAWLVVNGFLVDRFGELSWHGRPDIYRAGMLVVAGGLGQAVGRARRVMWNRRQRRSFEAEWRLLVREFDMKEMRDG
jgi:hypothetical protein